MKYLKMLGLAAVAAMALMAFVGAGTASATTLCKTAPNAKGECAAGWAYPAKTTVHATLKAGTSATLEDAFGIVKDTCTESTVHGETTNETGTTVNGNVDKLSFGGATTPCTMTTDVLDETGTLSVNSSGSVSGTSFEVTEIQGSETCIYGLGTGTTIGTFVSGNPAHITANATLGKLAGSGANCLGSAKWTATYVITSPAGTIDLASA